MVVGLVAKMRYQTEVLKNESIADKPFLPLVKKMGIQVLIYLKLVEHT